MPDKKPTDNEIVKECPFKKRIFLYKERIKDFFSRYENKSGAEDCIEVCLIREGYRTVLKAEEEINRIQAENSNLTADLTSLKNDLTSLSAENERLQGSIDGYGIQVANQREQIEKYEPIKETLCVLWETMSSIGVAKLKEKPTLEELAEAIDHIKAEAYKKFAKELHNKAMKPEDICDNFAVGCDTIHNLLKELMGDKE